MINKEIEKFIIKNMIQAKAEFKDVAMLTSMEPGKIKYYAIKNLARNIAENIASKDGIVEMSKNQQRMTTEIHLKVFCFSVEEILELMKMVKKEIENRLCDGPGK